MQIDKVTCLCLDKRKNQWSSLSNQVRSHVGLEMETFICGKGEDKDLVYDHVDILKPPRAPFYYGSPETINNHYNAFLCHKKMAQRAMSEGRESVLFLEDDAYFVDRFDKVWNDERVQGALDIYDWDIVYLGWWMKRTGYVSEDREDLEELWSNEGFCGMAQVPRPPYLQHEVCALHGLLVKGRMLPFIANAPAGPMDSYLNRNFDNIKAYFIYPKIIHVDSGWSFCENSFTERQKL